MDTSGTLAKRFWAKVDRQGSAECWRWLGSYNGPYGQIWHKPSGRAIPAHRASYALAGRDIPDGLEVDHTCWNKWCVNPGHLRAATPAANSINLPRQGRGKTGHRGVYRSPHAKNYRISVMVKGVNYHESGFVTVEEAAEAASALRRRLTKDSLADLVVTDV